MSAPFGSRTHGMAGSDLCPTRQDEDGIWKSLPDPAWQAPQPGNPVPRFPAGGQRELRALHLGPLSPEQIEKMEASLRRGDTQVRPLEPGLAVDLPEDFDREVMAAIEEAHPRRTYWRDASIGMATITCTVFGLYGAQALAGLWR